MADNVLFPEPPRQNPDLDAVIEQTKREIAAAFAVPKMTRRSTNQEGGRGLD